MYFTGAYEVTGAGNFVACVGWGAGCICGALALIEVQLQEARREVEEMAARLELQQRAVAQLEDAWRRERMERGMAALAIVGEVLEGDMNFPSMVERQFGEWFPLIQEYLDNRVAFLAYRDWVPSEAPTQREIYQLRLAVDLAQRELREAQRTLLLERNRVGMMESQLRRVADLERALADAQAWAVMQRNLARRRQRDLQRLRFRREYPRTEE